MRLRSVRTRAIATLLILFTLSTAALAGAVLAYGGDFLFQDFRRSNLALAETLAAGIRGEEIEQLRDSDALTGAVYQRHARFLQAAHRSQPYVTWIYTLNLNQQTGDCNYAAGSTIVPTETLWFESDAFEFTASRGDNGKLELRHDQKVQTPPFWVEVNGKRVAVEVRSEGGAASLHIGGAPIGRIISLTPLAAEIPTPIGRLDAANKEEQKSTINIAGQAIDIYYYFSAAGDPELIPGETCLDFEHRQKRMRQIAAQGEAFVDERAEVSNYGETLHAYAPIRKTTGAIVGLVVVESHLRQMEEFRLAVYRALGAGLLLGIPLVVVIAYFAGHYLTDPLVRMAAALSKVAAGDRSVSLAEESGEEYQQLSRSFNRMVMDLREADEQRQITTQAFARFVPKEFLSFLGRGSVTDVQLGDQVQRRMTVLFADIRSFTEISEAMSPEQSFRFINEYLNRVGPLIRRHGGFIDKYIGDAIMALFPGSPAQALRAAIDLQRRVSEFNAEGFLHAPIHVGVGLHTGVLMLGVIGESERMEGTVIADAVNLASRLEALTKTYGAAIIASETVIQELGDAGDVRYRFLDRVTVKGKRRPISIYEALEGAPEEEIAPKLHSQREFFAAMEVFRSGAFEKAAELFGALIEKYPEDRAFAHYLDRCREYAASGPPPDWARIAISED